MKQILYNIVGNAVKFTPEKGVINVKAFVEGKNLNIRIQDNGIGISKEDQEKLFKPFVQLDSASNRRYEGTGLGLALVKNLVELHDGSIRVESEPGKGSTFFLSIPVNMDKSIGSLPGTGSKDDHEDPDLSSAENIIILKPDNSTDTEPLILVVEDDEKSRSLLSEMLTDSGYRVVLADEGAKALEMAKTLHPFAITLDLNLPGMDGTEVLENLKMNENTSSIPVLVLSSLGKKDVGIVVGITEHLTKPIDSKRLNSILSDLKEKSGKSSLNILLIDDDPLVLEVLTEMIRPAGYSVVTASGGKEGIEKAFENIPDLLIIDLMMPDVNGFEVISTLKADPRTIHVPLIVCTAKDVELDELEFLNKHVSSIIQKGSFSKEDILDILGNLGQSSDSNNSDSMEN
ncbi:MAG: response regulator [Methanolobus sp.]